MYDADDFLERVKNTVAGCGIVGLIAGAAGYCLFFL